MHTTLVSFPSISVPQCNSKHKNPSSSSYFWFVLLSQESTDERIQDDNDCSCIVCSLKVKNRIEYNVQTIEQEMRNPPALLSSRRIRNALVTAKHVTRMEMGDSIEAYVLLFTCSDRRKTWWSCCTALRPPPCSRRATKCFPRSPTRIVKMRV